MYVITHKDILNSPPLQVKMAEILVGMLFFFDYELKAVNIREIVVYLWCEKTWRVLKILFFLR